MTVFYTPFERKLKKPFRNGAFSIKERKGILFKKILDQDILYSEASPLAGLSQETIEDIEQGKPCPSLDFALSTLKEDRLHTPIKLSAVIGLDDTLKAFEAIQKGFHTFKLKISPENQEVCLELMENLRIQYPHLKLRLDANGSFSLEQMKRLLQSLEFFSIEYFEDPIGDHTQIDKLKKICHIPLAIDNPLKSVAMTRDLLDLPFDYYILKPTLIGHIDTLQSIITNLESKNKKYIFSSLFESDIGIRKLYHLASQFHVKQEQGLATLSYFQESFFQDGPEITHMPPLSTQEEAYLTQLPWKPWPYV